MDRFSELKAFSVVASTGGFSAAARNLGIAPSSVVRLIDALERRVGARLLNRSTRTVTLTDSGRLYYESVLVILEQIEEAENLASQEGVPQGRLKISAPVTFSTLYLAPVCRELHRRYPLLQLELQLSDGVSNMIDESIDVAVRIGAVGDQPNVIARRLATHARVICASPQYLGQHGPVLRPVDLLAHTCLQFSYDGPRRGWRFRRRGDAEGNIEEINVQGNFFANNAEMLRQAALSGRGVVMLARWLVGEDIRAGRLVPLLEDYEANPGAMEVGIHAMYPANRRGSVKVKAFIDLLMEQLSAHPGVVEA